MKRRHALFALFLLGPLAACEKKDDPMSPDSVTNQPATDPEEEKRLRQRRARRRSPRQLAHPLLIGQSRFCGGQPSP
jgi:hypothetical protein